MDNRRHRIVATMRQTEMFYHWIYRATSLLYALRVQNFLQT